MYTADDAPYGSLKKRMQTRALYVPR